MAFRHLFLRAERHLARLGLSATLNAGPTVSDATVEARRALSLPLPESLITFYRDVGDGVEFRWQAPDDDRVFANVEVPPLLDLVRSFEKRKAWDVVFDDAFQWPYARDPARAKETALRIRGWLAFHCEGNGDAFCIDTAVDDDRVVFNSHEWMGTNREDNRWADCGTFRQFLEGWAGVCFQFPRSLYWPEVLSGDRINWNSNLFDPRFRLRPADESPALSD